MKRYYCFLKKFNNYFNRKIIKYEDINDYLDNSEDSFFPQDIHGAALPFDFNPNDNVTTEIIANDVPFDPDYFLLLDEDQNIIQRWFCIEQKRNRQGQWLYSLKRDVVSDNLNSLLRAPIFVQKGMLHEEDSFIFNDEGMSFNEIKKNEVLIKDRTGIAWIVGYIAKNKGGSDVSIQVPQGDVATAQTMSQIATYIGITEAQLVNIIETSGESIKGEITLKSFANYVDNTTTELIISDNFDNTLTNLTTKIVTNFGTLSTPYDTFMFAKRGLIFYTDLDRVFMQLAFSTGDSIENSGFLSTLKSNWASLGDGNIYLNETMFSKILDVVNKKIPISYNGQYFYLSININSSAKKHFNVDANNYPSLASAYSQAISAYNATAIGNAYPFTATGNAGGLRVEYNVQQFSLKLSVIPEDSGLIPTANTKISSSRASIEDQTFDMFVLPYSDIYFKKGSNILASSDIAKKVAMQIAEQLDDACYDIQLLPYFPDQNIIFYTDETGYYIDLTNKTEDVDFNYIKMTINGVSTNVGVIYWCKSASFGFNMLASFAGYTADSYWRMFIPTSSDREKKVRILCDKHRIVSPNYQGAFEFNLERNGGPYKYYNIDCTYKPFTPYIRVAPEFNLLYGTNFGDCRGLICGGDYSLPRITDKWYNFQLNNKNYQNIFNREIQNLDIRQGLEMRNQLVSGGVGIFSDTAKGAAAGAMTTGSPWGALAGGIIGGATSGIGFGIDVDTLARMQREARQLSIDKFNYQLGNVKALPYTITKLGSWNINSKIFPFLEFYTSTDEEKDALENKIKYESMTVMRIGTLEEFISNTGELRYFKGSLIRNDDIADDSHIVEAIYEELLKGVYI